MAGGVVSWSVVVTQSRLTDETTQQNGHSVTTERSWTADHVTDHVTPRNVNSAILLERHWSLVLF